MRVLLLGGTAEARALAARLYPDVDVISSLAGRVPDPALPAGPVRIGGFGGEAGLRHWLEVHDVDCVVDATHPFAATITAHAASACTTLGMPYVVLSRPAWATDNVITAASNAEAAKIVARHGYSRIFLTTGRSGVSAFADSDALFVVRVVTPPEPGTLPRRHRLVLSRGPYRYEDEYALMHEFRIEAMVTKNSGGAMTQPKLEAAAALGVAVVMIERPALPAGVQTVSTVDAALDWLTKSAVIPVR